MQFFLYNICGFSKYHDVNNKHYGQTGQIFRTVARQPALTWQAVCTEIVVRGLKCMKTIRSPSIELAYGTF